MVVHDLGGDEATLEVGVDDARCLWRGPAFVDRPRADFFGTGSEIALQAEDVVGGVDHLGQSRFGDVVAFEKLERVARVEAFELVLEFGADKERVGLLGECTQGLFFGLIYEGLLIHIEDVDDRFCGEEVKVGDVFLNNFFTQVDRGAGLQFFFEGEEIFVDQLGLRIGFGFFLDADETSIDRLKVGED